MKRFLIALGSIVVVAAIACVVLRFFKNASGIGGDGIDDDCEDCIDDCEGCSGDHCSSCDKF